ncbi:hypothetical protein HFN60_02345 [Rhizobium leguminosarum]|uniref:hypothetical protein n=1 Tax=Rhizobium leguminosarum TaxID=384 RepID=UPI001C9794AB|nr:hypothetical protein [Rhizobium leguminosarum]MBY5814501.1 hypothetical protein [Rhizobium leguminosarum]
MSPKPDLFPEAWPAIKATLAADASPVQWHMAISKCLDPRLRFRYLDPIKAIADSRKLKGEGFLILTIQCSIIEFLASLRRGWNYRQSAQWGVNFEYGGSKQLFTEFLCQTPPFLGWFPTEDNAEAFYKNIRCGLVHEAQTKDGWVIRSGASYPLIDFDTKIVNRDAFGDAINEYLDEYRQTLKNDQALQEAFVRKFDNLYHHASLAPEFAGGG